MTKKLPDVSKAEPSEEENASSQILNIDNLHYHGNDIRELTKLAKVNPELAEKVIKQRDNANSRHHSSYRFGLGASIALVGGVLASVSYLMVNLGILATFAAVGLILAVALLIRVVLTGNWSDTTWFGKVVQALAKALGSD
jgi:hypothetical protein